MRLSPLSLAVRRLRSLHFVPGGVQKFLDKALLSRADALILDLEDSVTPDKKIQARGEVSTWLEGTDFGKKSVCVRINALDTDLWKDDLSATLKKGMPDLYMVPKVSSRADIDKVDALLSELEAAAGREVGSTRLVPIVTEVPQAPLRAHEVACAPRIEAVTWGAEDLGAELGVKKRRDGQGNYLDVFQLCRTLTLLAAKGAGVQAIDTVYTDLRNTAGCRKESEQSSDTGFDGKMTLHPDQIDVVNAAFSPSVAEFTAAKELLAAAEGQNGAFKYKGSMIDRPHLRQAEKVVELGVDAEAAPPVEENPPWPAGPHHGKWFEELTVGRIIPHALTRTLTETDNIMFTTMSLNPAKLHLDYESAKGTQFGKPLVNSMFTLALVVGMSVLETTHGTTIANLGFEEITFPKPCFYGDSIRAETEVIKARASGSKPNQGIVTLEHRAFNQRGELVCKARRNALMLKKPADAE